MKTDQQNQQKSTKLKNIEANSYEQLSEDEKVIVDTRIIQGAKYRRIARMKNVKEQTVRTWFMEGGQYYAAYQWRKDFLAKEVQEENEDAKFQLQEGVGDAITVLKTQVAKGNLRAAVELLKMAGFNVQTIINNTESEGTKLLKELITARRNEKRKSRKIIQSSKSDNTAVSQSKENI